MAQCLFNYSKTKHKLFTYLHDNVFVIVENTISRCMNDNKNCVILKRSTPKQVTCLTIKSV